MKAAISANSCTVGRRRWRHLLPTNSSPRPTAVRHLLPGGVRLERVDETLDAVLAHGGEVATAPYREGDLRVATFRGAAGNLLGVWQESAEGSIS